MKLSEAIEKGYEIGAEKGIQQSTGAIYRRGLKGQIAECCALGFGLIGALGSVERFEAIGKKDIDSYEYLSDLIPEAKQKPNECLLNNTRNQERVSAVYEAVYNMNDSRKMSIPEIVETLKECGY